MKFFLLGLVVLWGYAFVAFGQVPATFSISNEATVHSNLSEYAFLFSDCSKKMKIEEIDSEAIATQFRPFSDSIELSPDCVHWLRLTIHNNLPHRTKWIFYVGEDNNMVDVFVYRTDLQGYDHKRTGIFVPPAERDVEEISLDSKVRLEFLPQTTKTIFIRYQNINNRPIKTKLELVSTEEFYERVKARNLTQGVFQGLIWIMVLYNFLIFILNNDRVYLYYSLYLLTTALFFLVISSLALDGIDGEVFHYVWYSTGLAIAFYFLFMRSFLQLKHFAPRLNTFVWVAIAFQVMLVAFVFIYYKLTKNVELIANLYSFSVIVQAIFALIILTTLIYINIKKKAQNKLIYFFVAGSTSLIVGTFLGQFIIALEIFPRLIGGFFNQLGVIAEILLFSLGLGYRMRISEEEKQEAQRKLILQLQENEILQRTLNQELEQKVKERTAEIETQKEEIKQKNEALEKRNKKIMDSIAYAARIQGAILGNPTDMEEALKDAFVLFRPRDIVSGDFYWYANLESASTSFQIVVAADCTGHGVPGAFMTVMGVDFLDDIVNNEKTWQPDQILYKLDQRITQAVTQRHGKGQQIRDGMDIAILVFDKNSDKAYFAGAKNPLFYIRNRKPHLIKGSVSAIGGTSRKKKVFNLHEFSYQTNDVFYLYSDGFQDQFGGEKQMKFMSKKFREKLYEISHLPLKEQKQILSTTFVKWKGDNAQTDDVLVIGLRTTHTESLH